MKNIIGLKDLRENMDNFVTKVGQGGSFLVVKKSKPIFMMMPPDTEEMWDTIVDFTNVSKKGVSAKAILKELKKLNA